jgi:hypothetical protein
MAIRDYLSDHGLSSFDAIDSDNQNPANAHDFSGRI